MREARDAGAEQRDAGAEQRDAGVGPRDAGADRRDGGVAPVGTGPLRPSHAGRALDAVRTAVRWSCLALLAALVLTPILQVVMRGVFTLPFSGAEELARYFLVCLTFIGASWVTQRGGQIRMEEFQAMLPSRPRWLLQMVIEISGVLVFAVFCVASLATIADNLDNQTATLEMPFWLFMGPLAVGSALLAVETAMTFGQTWRRGRPDQKQTTLS